MTRQRLERTRNDDGRARGDDPGARARQSAGRAPSRSARRAPRKRSFGCRCLREIAIRVGPTTATPPRGRSSRRKASGMEDGHAPRESPRAFAVRASVHTRAPRCAPEQITPASSIPSSTSKSRGGSRTRGRDRRGFSLMTLNYEIYVRRFCLRPSARARGLVSISLSRSLDRSRDARVVEYWRTGRTHRPPCLSLLEYTSPPRSRPSPRATFFSGEPPRDALRPRLKSDA